MDSSPKVIGLSLGHDGGCALLQGDTVRVAVSEERLTRRKYASGWISSLKYCLETAGLQLADIDLFVFSCGGSPLPQGYDGGLRFLGANRIRCLNLDHHLSHAVGGYCCSSFDEALVVVLDALGNNADTETYYVARGNEIRRIGGNNPHRKRAKGIGATYEAFTNFLGLIDQESGKVMALAAYGDSDCFRETLFDLVDDQVASRLESTHQRGVYEFAKKTGLRFGDPFPESKAQRAKDIAAYVQRQTETTIIRLLDYLLHKTGIKYLCLSGGVAMNCVINTTIRRRLQLDGLFVLPPATDVGQALGNAIYGFYYLTGELPRKCFITPFFGREYHDKEMMEALHRLPSVTPYGRLLRKGYLFSKETDIAMTVAQRLAAGQTVGWFQGGSELGPRALGHRSIVADARSLRMRDILNKKVKHREWFRPFAVSVMEESVPDYFDKVVTPCFMTEAPTVFSSRRHEIEAAQHVDFSARLHTVSETCDPLFYKLISQFESITGVPAVVNTSYNCQEPIVETPGDALYTFLTTDLDCAAIGDYLVENRTQVAV